MHARLSLVLAGLLGLAAAPVMAQGLGFGLGMHDVVARAGGGGAAPLDGFTTPSAAYSFRKLRSAYAGSAVKLRRVDTTTADIGFSVAGDFDTAAAAAFCTTACTIQTLYDQSGNGRNAAQATPATQPPLVFNCNGTLPCLRLTAASERIDGPSITPATGVASLSLVAKRQASTANECNFRMNGLTGNRLQSPASIANQWRLNNNTTAVTAPATDGAWHVFLGLLNGAGSYLSVDDVPTAGALTGNVAAGAPAFVGGGAVCDFTEGVIWDNYALTPAERTALQQNQQQYWIPLPLDGFTQPSFAFSFRKLRSAYAGPAVLLRRASDNGELDINFLGFVPGLGAPLDVASANSHCAATTCFVKTWYDQSGGGRHVVQATAGNQPGLQLNCLAGLPCARVTLGTAQLLQYVSVTPTSPISLNAVSRQAVRGTQACGYLYVGAGNQIVQHPTLDVFQMSNGGSTLQMAAAALAWHSHTGVYNAAASVARVDGTETPGTLAMAVGTGNIAVNYGGTGATCDATEVVYWDAYALTAGERAALQQNQKSFWGTP